LLWDGSPHHWFGKATGPCNLTAVIDDASGALLHGVFTLEEDAQSYLRCLRAILLEKGIPLGLYMDRHGIFRRPMITGGYRSNCPGEQSPTQVGQALRELGIEAIFALSPQARDASNDCSIPCRTVWFRSSGLQGLVRLKRRRALLTDRSKPISTRALPRRPGKAKPHGGPCPRELMSIGSAAFTIKPVSATIMGFALEESSWISRQVRVIEVMPKLASRYATS
jgi:hypothetical protein